MKYEYTIIHTYGNPVGLEDEVRKAIDSGWRLHGFALVFNGMLCQPMIREREEEEEDR